MATAPQNVSATAISATNIFVVWTRPASSNGILHDYKIRYKAAANFTYGTSISAGLTLNYTISDLYPFTEYEIQVRILELVYNMFGDCPLTVHCCLL